MPFQPFGYKFDITSRLLPPKLKSALRAKTKGLFDAKDGPRGWVAGPVICLWFTAFNRLGPMLIGWISADHRGSRVTGRAGSDLNGVAALALFPLIAGFLFYDDLSNGTFSFEEASWFVVPVALLIPLVFWLNHRDRKNAEPLVRFLRDVAEERKTSSRPSPPRNVKVASNLMLNVSGTEMSKPVTAEDIYEALLAAGSGAFVILSSDTEKYIQTVSEYGRYIIEKREGDDVHHFRARRQGNTNAAHEPDDSFTVEETLAAFLAYAAAGPAPPFIAWDRIDV